MPDGERQEFVDSLPPKRKKELAYTGYYWLRDDQVIPLGCPARYIFCHPGRGFGKTRMGATYMQYMVEHVYPGTRGKLGIVAPTHTDISKTILDEFNKIYPPGQGPDYIENKNEYRFKNGTVVYTHSSDQPLRGASYSFVWCDEMVAWCDGIGDKIAEKFSVLDFACRENEAQFLITTTPKPFKIFKDWEKAFHAGDPLVHVMRGSTTDNAFLSPHARRALEQRYAGGRFGRQELDGAIVDDNPFALWSDDDFEGCRLPSMKGIATRRTVVALDPAVTANEGSDMTGIIVASLGFDKHSYVLKDATMKAPPDAWAKRAVELVYAFDADCIVAEVNNGGDMIEALIKTIDPTILVKKVRATKNKIVRAEPVANLYKHMNGKERESLVHHVGDAKNFRDLEEQCVSYVPNARGESPDRLDALVWALTELYWGTPTASTGVSARWAMPF